MILVLGGTSDARSIARALKRYGHKVLLTAVTEYGAPATAGEVDALEGQLDALRLSELLTGVTALVDATHPFATRISRLAIQVCAEKGVPYIRYERPWTPLPPMSDVVMASGADKAAVFAVELAEGDTIFLDAGSDGLRTYVDAARTAGNRIVARVQPNSEVIADCERFGMRPWDLVALQGPMSRALQIELLRRFDARVLVVKESGTEGSVLDKLASARALHIPTVVVARPRMDYPMAAATEAELLAAIFDLTGELPSASEANA